MTSSSIGISKATVNLTNLSTGEIKTTRTSSLGYFSFSDLPTMNTYELRVENKFYRTNRTIFLMDDSIINIIAE